MFKTYLEIISKETYKEFEKENQQYLASEKYKQRLEELLKRFFTNQNGKIVNTIIVPYISPNEYSITSIDKEIINYLNNYGYICTEESYLLGYCINNKNKEMPIVDVLKMISQYNLEKLEKQKQENVQYSTQYDKRIKAKQNFKENYLTYYQNFNKNRSKVIAFTWLPRAIASMSTNVGWTSCMNLYDGQYRNYVFPTIEAGAFIAWLVQEGDEEILNDPQARILIKAYVSDNDKIFWYPSKHIYGTAPKDFYEKVKDFVIKKQEIYITKDDLESAYKFDTSQYLDSLDTSRITLKTLFKEKYVKVLENKIKNNTKFTITNLEEAIQFNVDINLIKKILENIKHELNNKDYEKILELAYNYNNYNIINFILSNPTYNNLLNKTILFLYAVKTNNISAIKDLLQQGVDPSINNNTAIQIAAEKGYIEIIKLLLKDKRINPSDQRNDILQTIVKYGYTEIVKLLLKDPRVDPSDQKNRAIQTAAEKGYVEIVKLLLKDPRVDPSDFGNFAIRKAAKNGHIEVVKLLLQDSRVNPKDFNNYAIKAAAEKGHIEMVKLLLQDERVDPSDNNNRAIRYAAENGHIEVVKLLLQDKRVDPSDNNNYALRYAIKNKHIDIIKLLLQDQRVRSTININNFIQLAQQNNQQEIVTLLQQYK